MTDQVKEITVAALTTLTVLLVLDHFVEVVPSESGLMGVIALMVVAAFAILLSGYGSSF